MPGDVQLRKGIRDATRLEVARNVPIVTEVTWNGSPGNATVMRLHLATRHDGGPSVNVDSVRTSPLDRWGARAMVSCLTTSSASLTLLRSRFRSGIAPYNR